MPNVITVFAIYLIMLVDILRCLRLTKSCWVGKHSLNVIMKPTNSPTQGQPNPTQEKLGYKWHLGHFFPQQKFFRGLGLILYTPSSKQYQHQKPHLNTINTGTQAKQHY